MKIFHNLVIMLLCVAIVSTPLVADSADIDMKFSVNIHFENDELSIENIEEKTIPEGNTISDEFIPEPCVLEAYDYWGKQIVDKKFDCSRHVHIIPDSDCFYKEYRDEEGNPISNSEMMIAEGVLDEEDYYWMYDHVCDPVQKHFDEEVADFGFIIDYNPYMEKMILYDQEGNVADEYVFEDLVVCGDNVCDDSETHFLCPYDCKEVPIELETIFVDENGVDPEFPSFAGTVSGTENVVIYVDGECPPQDTSCVEISESLGQVNVYVQDDNKIKLTEFGNEKVILNFVDGSGEVLFETEKGKALVSQDAFKVSFSDWEDLPVIVKRFLDSEGNPCEEIFDVTTTEKLSVVCGN